MPRVRRSLVLVIVASIPVAACTALVQFHDQPGSGGDASVVEGGAGHEAAGDTATVDSGAGDDASGGDSMAAADHFNPCSGKASGYYCGNNGLEAGLPPNDIVHCLNNGVATATPCAGGCLHVVDPFPDACNPCFGVADGMYCGRQLAGFPTFNGDILIQCQGGAATQQTACASGCSSVGTMSVCN
jgi:hypothetical protein